MAGRPPKTRCTTGTIRARFRWTGRTGRRTGRGVQGRGRRGVRFGGQSTHDQMHNRHHPRKISMNGPDGKPNWEWIAGSIRQVDVFGMAYLLAALRRVAPDVADHATAFLAEQGAVGDSIGELVCQWQDELRKGEPLRLPAVPSPEPGDGEFLS